MYKEQITNTNHANKRNISLVEEKKEELNKLRLQISLLKKQKDDAIKSANLVNVSINGYSYNSFNSYQWNDPDYKKMYQELKSTILENLMCPLSFSSIESPSITPSGHTIEESYLKKLVYENQKDPFTRQSRCTTVTPNRFAKAIKDKLTELMALENQRKQILYLYHY